MMQLGTQQRLTNGGKYDQKRGLLYNRGENIRVDTNFKRVRPEMMYSWDEPGSSIHIGTQKSYIGFLFCLRVLEPKRLARNFSCQHTSHAGRNTIADMCIGSFRKLQTN